MFSFYYALISVLILSIHGHSLQLRTFPVTNIKNVGLFGELQKLIDQSNQQTLATDDMNTSDGRQDELTFISCERIRPYVKQAFPADKTKYFICKKDQTPELFTCPNGGIFDDREKACIDLCQQNNPCLNQGQCIILPNLQLECVCRRDWTGENCEIPLSSCAKNPCGMNNECRMLQSPDYDQDYVCICEKHQSYGKNCQRTVPNPCLSTGQQFHAFAFSRHAYINCDDELIFFQPCNARLYWNQEDKRCDRSLPDILRSPFLNIKAPKDKFRNRPQFISLPKQINDDDKDELLVVMVEKPIITVTEWQETRIPIGQFRPEIGPQTPDMRKPTVSRFVFQKQGTQPSTSSMSTNVMATTVPAAMATKPFRLEGFANKDTVNQQMTGNVMMNPQARFGPMQSSFFEPSTTTPKPIVNTLLGWKTNPEDSSNQMTTRNMPNMPSKFQTRAWMP